MHGEYGWTTNLSQFRPFLNRPVIPPSLVGRTDLDVVVFAAAAGRYRENLDDVVVAWVVASEAL